MTMIEIAALVVALAFAALVVALIAGVVPADRAFAGFGHPATVIIALVLVVSRGLSNSGAIELLSRFLMHKSRSLRAHIGLMASFAAASAPSLKTWTPPA